MKKVLVLLVAGAMFSGVAAYVAAARVPQPVKPAGQDGTLSVPT